MRKCKVGIIGFGTVGSGIYKILSSEVASHPILKEIEIAKIAVKDLNKKRDIELDNDLLTDDPFKLINDPSIDVIVEVMGGVDLAKDIILQSLKLGKSVVTANKAVYARYGEEIYKTASKEGVYILSEAAVCGGIPIIEPLKRSLKSNSIKKMVGIINGTTNFILSKMTNEKATWNCYSASLVKVTKIRDSIPSIRGKRYFDLSKMSFYNLIIHSFSIISVFKINVIIRSIGFIILYTFLIKSNFSIITMIPIVLVIIFVIAIFKLSKRENIEEYNKCLENISDIEIVKND